MQVKIEKCEARFRYKKIEFIATGGLTNGPHNGMDAFLEVAVPSTLVQNANFL